jgi:hypothetical protein
LAGFSGRGVRGGLEEFKSREGLAMRTVVVQALIMVSVLSQTLAATPKRTLEINTYPIVADSVSSPSTGDKFLAVAREKLQHLNVDLNEKSVKDTTLEWPEFDWRVGSNHQHQAVSRNGIKWSLEEEPTEGSMFRSFFTLYRNDSVLYRWFGVTTRAAIPGFLGVATGPEGWVLQCFNAHITNDSSGQHWDSVSFHVVVNGIDVGDSLRYQSSSDYRYLDSLPFYFYEKDGTSGCNYGGHEYLLSVDKIARTYGGAVTYNPRFDDHGFIAYGLWSGIWYAVVGRVRQDR